MEGRLGSHGMIGTLPGWTLLFAREPESDLPLHVTEPSTAPGTPSSPTPQKPPRLRILVLIVLLLVVAGGAYIAMDPELVMKLMGEDQPVPPAPARTPARSPVAPPPSPPEPTAEMEPTPSVPLPSIVPSPLFGEGQHVIAVLNRTTPTAPLLLNQDSAGTLPGPSVKSTDTLVVLDAELQGQSWVYFVRNDEGAKGWVAEKQLAAKP